MYVDLNSAMSESAGLTEWTNAMIDTLNALKDGTNVIE